MERARTEIPCRLLQFAVHGGERGRGDPDREHETLNRVDQDHARIGSVQAQPVEDPRYVHVHRKRGERLRQQKQKKEQASPGQPAPPEGESGRDGNRQACHDNQQRDEHRVDQGDPGIPLRPENALPEREAPLDRKLVRIVPDLGDGPEQHVRQRTEYGKREQSQDHSAEQRPQGDDSDHWGRPPCWMPWRRYIQAITAVMA